MALFNIAGPSNTPPSVYEVPGKIYIFGQAHDAETLTPIFGDFLRGTASVALQGGNNRPMVSLTHRSISPIIRAVNLAPDDRARTISNSVVDMYSSISLPNGDYITICGSAGSPSTVTKFNSLGEIKSAVNINENTFGTELAFFHEDEINIYAVGSRTSANHASAVGNRYVSCINKTTLGVTSVSYGTLTSAFGGAGNTFLQTPLWKDAEGSVFIVNSSITSTNTNTKQWTATKITKGGIVSVSAMQNIMEFSGGSLGSGSIVSSSPVYLHDDDQFIYFMVNAIDSSVSVTASSNKLVFIGKIQKDNLALSRAQEANSVFSVDDGVDMSTYASLLTGFAQQSFTHDIRELRRTTTHAFYLVTLVKTSQASFTGLMAGTSFSIVLRINLADFADQTVMELFKHRANVGCSGIMPINQEKDQFLVSYDGAGADFVQYSHASNKITKREQLEFPLAAAMVDQMGRIWAQDSASTSLHLFSPTMSSTIRVGFEDRTLKYNGIPVSSNIQVSAFNHIGDRVANNVTLTLEGNAATFSDGEKTTTVMTRADGDLMVPYVLSSNGYVRVTAVVAV